MCKHVAAVFYGIGARLDREPELLFKLRDLDHLELIAAPGAADLAVSPATREKIIAEDDLAGIFGIEIDEGPAARRPAPEKPEPAAPLRGRRSKQTDSVEISEPPKRKRGRPRLTPITEAPVKPRRGRPPLVRKEISRTRAPKPTVPMETPEPVKRKRGRPPKKQKV
jgi:hypothetical protein